MPGPAGLTRSQLLAYRILATGLDRRKTTVERLALWDVGLQDRSGTATQALAARVRSTELDRWLAGPPLVGNPAAKTTFALAWTWRGSPHFHRRTDLPQVAAALWPADEADAAARLGGSAKALAGAGVSALDGYRTVSTAVRRAVRSTTVKGEASTALTQEVPAYATWCEPCQVKHVPEMLFRSAPLFGGLGLVPGVPATLAPLRPTVKQPAEHNGLAAFARSYLELYGAGTRAEAADFFGVTATQLRPDWPGTVDVTVDGVKLQTTQQLLDAVAAADVDRAAEPVRLLPPGDPLLQPRERILTAPDKATWKALWPSIGPAGAVLADGGLAGTWRTAKAGKSLRLTVSPFRRLTAATRSAVEEEAQPLAGIRELDETRVVFGDV